MDCVRKVTGDLYWVGGDDRRLALFENVFPIPRGVSYNSYLLLDEKTVLFDTVDRAVSDVFFENIAHVLNGRQLDYIIVQHMEPDHAATLADTLLRYPDAKLVCTAKAETLMNQYFAFSAEKHAHTVKEKDTLCVGHHTLAFLMAPMVHWPEVMVTYDVTDHTLFSADAFGTFGAIGGNLFADEVEFERDWLADARRYYTNIVGKYGQQVQVLLAKASGFEIERICPLHGPIWRRNVGWFIHKYQLWSKYQPEEKSVMIAYASVYGHTENAVNRLAVALAEKGVRNIAIYDVSVTHPSYLVAEAFRCSHLVFASTTYNAGVFCNMETLLIDLQEHNFQNRTVALIENGSWAPMAGQKMRALLGEMKNITVLPETLTLASSLKESQRETITEMATAIAKSMGM